MAAAAAASQQTSCSAFISGSTARAVKVKSEPTDDRFKSQVSASDVLLCQIKSEVKTEADVWTAFKSSAKPPLKKTELEQISNIVSTSTSVPPVQRECVDPRFSVYDTALNGDDSPDTGKVLCSALTSADMEPDEKLPRAIPVTDTSNKRQRQTHKSVKSQEKPAMATSRKQKVEQARVCTLCGKSFTRSSHLKIHMRIHTGEKPYKCTECDKCFARSGELDVHMRFHKGEKPYGCSVCGKHFSSSTHLKEHKWTHSGTKPHACNQCDKSFTHAGDLVKHHRIHTGQRPYPCLECGMAFRRTGTLKKHQKRHARANSFTCTYCKKVFCSEGRLQKHMKSVCKMLQKT